MEVQGVNTAEKLTSFQKRLLIPKQKAQHAPLILALTFALYILAIPIATIRSEATGGLTLTVFSAGLLILVSACYPRQTFSKPSAPIIALLGYIAFEAVTVISVPSEHFSEGVWTLVTHLQLWVLAWIISGLMRQQRMFMIGMWTYAVATAAFAAASKVGILGGSIDGRDVGLSGDANDWAGVVTVALTIAIGLANGIRNIKLLPGLIAATLVLVLLLPMMSTGSRSGFLAMAIGMLGLVVLKDDPTKMFWRRLLLVSVLCISSIVVLSSPALNQRLSSTFQKGELSGRDVLYPSAIAMIKERPLSGWGPDYQYEVLRRSSGILKGPDIHEQLETHNAFLTILTESGVFGLMPFLYAIGLMLVGAWRARDTFMGSIPFAVFLVVMLMNNSASLVTTRFTWLGFAIAAASWSITNNNSKRKKSRNYSVTDVNLTPKLD